MSDVRVCVVKLIDGHGVTHKVKVRAESVYDKSLATCFVFTGMVS